MQQLAGRLQAWQQRIEGVLDEVLPAVHAHPGHLHTAMRYVTLDGGKRVRPLLVYATGEVLGATEAVLDIPAAAVELVHVYSLVHDDLPAMDNDDLRRGKPTCHKAFDEATAILVGDALQALAFQLLATHPRLVVSEGQRLRMLGQLAFAAGSRGMVGGQALDLAAVGRILTEMELEDMHIHKTGALIRASVLLGAYSAPQADEGQVKALDRFAKCIGLAFQVQDDILDVLGDAQTLGKNGGVDAAAGKPTYPSIMGLAAAQAKLQDLYTEALDALAIFGRSADVLRDIAAFTVRRRH